MSSTSKAHKTHGQHAESDDELGLERLVFFSDAVFAIAITLLALEIRLPVDAAELSDQQLLTSLIAIWPKYLSYVISFLVIGNYWIAHHRRFRLITRYDTRLLLLNLLSLMAIAFIPFPTAIISENGNRTATVFYALSMAATGLLSALLWWHASWKNRLIDAHLDAKAIRHTFVSILIVPTIFILSTGLAWIDPGLTKFSWLLIIPAALLLR
ncbi:MAG: TMEM175 family protein [Caldilineaceae bacterium]